MQEVSKLSNYYSNPTANAAIGNVDKEIHQMRKRAAKLKALHKKGLLTPSQLVAARRQFVGIHRRALEEALDLPAK